MANAHNPYATRDFTNRRHGLARQLLIRNARRARPERVRRLRGSAIAHLCIARMTWKQARAHRMLVSQLRREALLHAYLNRLCEKYAREREQASLGPARMLRWFGQEHLKQVHMARQEEWAHRELAARSAARALWHRSCTTLIWKAQLHYRGGPLAGW
jgi:hypothetical protein